MFFIIFEFHEVVGFGFDLCVDRLCGWFVLLVALFLLDDLAVDFCGGEVLDDVPSDFWGEAATEVFQEGLHDCIY